MLVWKYTGKEISREQVEKALASISCFKCGKELHSDECPFAKLKAELRALLEQAAAEQVRK
ncbi:MAG: hypothetical protein ACUVRC_06470 [Desulfotomaculales bacterium]